MENAFSSIPEEISKFFSPPSAHYWGASGVTKYVTNTRIYPSNSDVR